MSLRSLAHPHKAHERRVRGARVLLHSVIPVGKNAAQCHPEKSRFRAGCPSRVANGVHAVRRQRARQLREFNDTGIGQNALRYRREYLAAG